MKKSFYSIALLAGLTFAQATFAVDANQCPELAGTYANCETTFSDGSSNRYMPGMSIQQDLLDGVSRYTFSNIDGDKNTDVVLADGVIRPFLVDGGAAIGVFIQRKHECKNGQLMMTHYYPYSNNPEEIQSTMDAAYSLTETGDLKISFAYKSDIGSGVAICQKP